MLPLLLAAALHAAHEPAALAVVAADAAPSTATQLVEMTHQLRAACRERDPEVQDVRDMRARLLGDRAAASLQELERAYAGALLTASLGDAAGAARTLRAVVAELERTPASAEAFEQWTRAQLRLAHVELAAGHLREYRDALELLAAVHPGLRPDPDQFSPTFRRDLDAAAARVAARPRPALRIVTAGRAPQPVEVFVDGRPVGVAPVTLQLAAGRHRVSGAAGALRIPPLQVDVGPEGAEATLDAGLAASVDVNAGPALAVGREGRDAAAVKLGAWLDASRVVVASLATEAGALFLVGAIYDVASGALLREGRVRTAHGLAATEHVAALSAFLLTGQPSPAIVSAGAAQVGSLRATPSTVTALAVAPVERPLPRASRTWMRPAAVLSVAAALGAGAFSLQNFSSARAAARSADALIRPDGTYVGDAATWAHYHDAASSAARSAWIGVAGTAAFAATAGVLGYLSWDRGAPVVRF